MTTRVKNPAFQIAQVTLYLFVLTNRYLVVAVAQLVEHRIVIPSVAGSSPVGHPNSLLFSLVKHSR